MVRIPCRNPTAAEDTAKFDSAEKPPIKPVCHSEQSEESRVFQDLRPFTEPALSRTRSFAALRMTEGEGFRVTFRGHSSAESKFIPRPYKFRSGAQIHHCSFKFLASCLEDFLKRLAPQP